MVKNGICLGMWANKMSFLFNLYIKKYFKTKKALMDMLEEARAP